MTRWSAHAAGLIVFLSLFGCVSTPPKAPETIGFARAAQLGGPNALWVMKDDASGQSQVNLGAEGNSGMTWSPDGTHIAFESNRDGNLEIYTARITDGGDGAYGAEDIQRRTISPADDTSPAWSPDCALLAFSSNRTNPLFFNVYQLDVRTNAVTPMTTGNYVDLSPSWSPDGTKIAFTRKGNDGSREIYVHVMNSGQDMRLTNNNVNDTDPSWSPSGRIIFSRHSEDGSRAGLFEMDAIDANGDGNGDHMIPMSTPEANEYDQKPDYSRTGWAIVFFRSQGTGGGGPGDLWKLVIQDGTVMEPVLNLTRTDHQHEHGPAWRRNGVCARNAD